MTKSVCAVTRSPEDGSFCPAVVLHLASMIHSSCIKEIAQVSCTEEPHVDAALCRLVVLGVRSVLYRNNLVSADAAEKHRTSYLENG